MPIVPLIILLLCLLLWSYYGHIMPIMHDYGQVMVIYAYCAYYHAYYSAYYCGHIMVTSCLLCMIMVRSWSYMPIVHLIMHIIMIIIMVILWSHHAYYGLLWSGHCHSMPIVPLIMPIIMLIIMVI